MHANQQLTFLSDGGDTVRNLPRYLHPQAEHILGCIRIAMRVTVMTQMVTGVCSQESPQVVADLAKNLERVKWYLWDGNVFRALQVFDTLQMDLETIEESPEQRKLLKAIREFGGYVAVNKPSQLLLLHHPSADALIDR
jgi:hypothetical protein